MLKKERKGNALDGKNISSKYAPAWCNNEIIFIRGTAAHNEWVPVTKAWRVLRLRMEERPPDIEGSCEYIQ
jgi:hypothetical protein